MSSRRRCCTHNHLLGKTALAASFAVALGISPVAKPAVADAAEIPAEAQEDGGQAFAAADEAENQSTPLVEEPDGAEETEEADKVEKDTAFEEADSDSGTQLLSTDDAADASEAGPADVVPGDVESGIEDAEANAVSASNEDADTDTETDAETEAEADEKAAAVAAAIPAAASSADTTDIADSKASDDAAAEAASTMQTTNDVVTMAGSTDATLMTQSDEDGWEQYTVHGSSIEWKIDDDGQLTIRPIDGTSGVLRLYDEGTSYEYSHYPDYSISPHGNSYITSNTAPWYLKRSSIKSFAVADGCTITCLGDISFLFDDAYHLTALNVSGLDTSGVTNMAGLIHSCEALTSVDLSQLDTSHVTNMDCMFHWCTSLTSVNLAGWDTSSVTDMKAMFRECNSLTSVDLSGFDTSNVEGMCLMFENCSSLTSLDLSNFDTSSATDMYGMFKGCDSLETLDISNFTVSDDCYVADMFEGTTALQEVKLGDGFKFVTFESALLETPSGDGYTGRWVRVGADGAYLDPAYAPEDLRDNWNASLAGTWVWEKESTPKPEPAQEVTPTPAKVEVPEAEPCRPAKPAKHVPVVPAEAALPQTGDMSVAGAVTSALAGLASAVSGFALRRKGNDSEK